VEHRLLHLVKGNIEVTAESYKTGGRKRLGPFQFMTKTNQLGCVLGSSLPLCGKTRFYIQFGGPHTFVENNCRYSNRQLRNKSGKRRGGIGKICSEYRKKEERASIEILLSGIPNVISVQTLHVGYK
jgi:hypothetical protein